MLFCQTSRPKTATNITSKSVLSHRRNMEMKEEERMAREEEFLMQFWYVLNPYGDREKVEGRVLYVFLKLVIDPYWDGSQESID